MDLAMFITFILLDIGSRFSVQAVSRLDLLRTFEKYTSEKAVSNQSSTSFRQLKDSEVVFMTVNDSRNATMTSQSLNMDHKTPLSNYSVSMFHEKVNLEGDLNLRDKRHAPYDDSDRSNDRQLKRDEKRKSPFSAVIRLSVGCTGTLLTTRHVLTAAHCVHNGTHLTINSRTFHIEFPSYNGRTSQTSAVEIRLPRKWTNSDTYSKFRAMYDFSIITLRHRIPSYLVRPRVAITQTDPDNTHNQLIQFAGFPTGSPSAMWRTVCSFRGARYIHEGNVLHLKRCTASPGYSGAGIFKVSHRNRMQLVGVVSHLLQRKSNGQRVDYIVVSAFTRKKKLLLCNMMSNESLPNDFCGTIEVRQRSTTLPYVIFDISDGY